MKTKNIKTHFVFSENNILSIRIDAEANIWCPINFQWIPVMKLSKSMNQ